MKVKVKALRNQVSGAVMHRVGDEWEEDSEVAREKQRAGLVEIGGKVKAAKSDAAPEDKSEAAPENKAATARKGKAAK